MKSIFIHEQLEYRLEINGDQFYQGDCLPCTVTVKNLGAAPRQIPGLELSFARGSFNKIREKASDSFDILETQKLKDEFELAPGDTATVTHTFELGKNCTVTEKTQSIYCLYGSDDTTPFQGNLLVTVYPHSHIQQVLSIMESTFQFVCKGVKSSHEWAEAKLKPSTARKLSLLDELVLGFRFQGELLQLRYRFRVKKFDTSATSVGVKKGKTEVEQQFTEKEYLLTPTHVNPTFLEAKIEEALSIVSTGL